MSVRRQLAVAAARAGVQDEERLDLLSSQEIGADLRTTFVGRRLVYLPETPSTNAVARRLARGGAGEGLLVVADYQSAGRGRLGRRWQAPPGSSLLLSLLFRPPLAPAQMQRLTMVCGLAAADAIEAQTGLQVGLKWPNDVLIGDRKVGGILTELELCGNQVDFAIVGLGLNVNLEARVLAGLAERPQPQASSLSHALGRGVPRLPLLLALLEAIEGRYLALCQGQSPRTEWARRLTTLGQRVVVSGAGPRLEGLAVAVDADGALQLRLDDGGVERVLAGDVTLQPGA